MKNQTKTLLFAALIAAMILPFSGMMMVEAVPNENANDKARENTLTDKPNIPLAPTDIGCAYFTDDASKFLDQKPKWIEKECMTEEEKEGMPIPNIGGTNGVRGVEDSTSDLQTYGLVDIEFSTFTGINDSVTNDEHWSIQDNTNQWRIGGTGDWYIVQFTEQEWSGGNSACIWQINVSTQSYPKKCVSADSQTLTSSYHASVEGKVLTNGNLQVQFCEIAGNTQCWVTTDTDDNDLAGHWDRNSGTILGVGSSSTAEFDTPTDVTTKVKTGPAQGWTNVLDTSTAEENDLDYDNSSTSCAFSICTRTVDASN